MFVTLDSDMVYVAPSTYHWVQSLGTCVNLSWNIGPPTGTQYIQACLAEERNLTRVSRLYERLLERLDVA